MKQVQMLFDEELLSRLDNDADVREFGRSAVLRRLAAEYLRSRRSRALDEQYRRGYVELEDLGAEFEGWEDEGSWPDR